ncbi:MAG: hypothetical protein ACD_75C02524G0001, partial [uncultured bacterium]
MIVGGPATSKPAGTNRCKKESGGGDGG